MALQTPLVLISGAFSTLPPGDTLGPSTDPVAQASGNAGISIGLTALASGNAALVRANTALASGNAGISTGLTALASGNAGISTGLTALASGNAGISTGLTALASGNAGISTGLTALASGNAGISTGLTALASGNAGLVSASNKVPISGGYMTGQLFAASGVIVSGTLTVGINSAAAPSLVFNGDQNTGIFSPGADQLAISTGGTSRLAVSTTAVSSTLAVDVPLGASGTPSLTFTGDLNTGLFSPGADTLALVTAGTSRLHIASGGLVGLGTSSPTSPLTIAQAVSVDTGGSTNKWTAKFRDTTATAINVGGGLLFQGIKSAASGVGNFAGIAGLKENATDNNEDGYLAFSTTTNTTGLLAERARIDSSGRLLVGTSSTATVGDSQYARLQVKGNTFLDSGNAILNLQRGQAATAFGVDTFLGTVIFSDSTGGEFARIDCRSEAASGASDYPGRLVFSTTLDGASSPTERMRIDNGGNLSITTVTSKAGGSHTLQDNGATPNTVRMYNSTDANNTGSRFLVCDAAASILRAEIRSNGGLANYSANNVNLSDINAKKDISPSANTWSCLKEWEIVNFRYKDQPEDADLNLGVIAQQVAESCPEVITIFQEAKEATNEAPAQEERLGVKDQQMMWMAIKALQEAMERIEVLEAEVAALKGA
jgi:hypothetical protein